ncbi:MAG: peroxiredoxin [Candidatus Binatus sp.]|jgi:peroxiredoxin Q/BCP|uniref:peroxiredoxin n=1 Tax=Candidatus Binatus sp. TaxID=2811406 RepID=UPI003C72B059
MPPADANSIPDLSTALELAVPDARGELRRLKDFRGHNVVVYFYPKDDTPGCTVEGKEFRDSYDQFKALDCVVIGVSTDSAERHRAFAEKHALPFILLADEDGKLAAAFGVLNGKYAARSTFVLDSTLRLRRALQDVTPRGHAAQVLNFVRTLVESHRMIGG